MEKNSRCYSLVYHLLSICEMWQYKRRRIYLFFFSSVYLQNEMLCTKHIIVFSFGNSFLECCLSFNVFHICILVYIYIYCYFSHTPDGVLRIIKFQSDEVQCISIQPCTTPDITIGEQSPQEKTIIQNRLILHVFSMYMFNKGSRKCNNAPQYPAQHGLCNMYMIECT